VLEQIIAVIAVLSDPRDSIFMESRDPLRGATASDAVEARASTEAGTYRISLNRISVSGMTILLE